MKAKYKPKLLFIFAHPDDEAFGPSGSLIKMTKEYDIYFLCATKGEAGVNSIDCDNNISSIRQQELIASTKIIGAKDVHFLGFCDGRLCNDLYHELADKIQYYVNLYKPEVLMSWENRGVSGHIDHIVVSMVTHFVFYRSPVVKRLLLYCLSKYQTNQFLENYYIYRPDGYNRQEIDIVYDTSDVWDQKLKAMKAHRSQIADLQKIMNRPKVRLMEDCYIEVKK